MTLTALPVRAAAINRSVWRQRKAGICSTSTACAASAHCAGSCTSVSTGRPSDFADFGEDRQRVFEPDAARGAAGRAVRLVERGLEHEADAASGRDLLQRARDFEGVGADFELAGAGDEGERQIGAEGDGAGGAADANVGVGLHQKPRLRRDKAAFAADGQRFYLTGTLRRSRLINSAIASVLDKADIAPCKYAP